MKIFGIAGLSGSGKTTLLEKLIAHFVEQCLRVAVIKHAHHGFDIDRPGKDSWRHREAGASQVLLTCDKRWALLSEQRDEAPPTLDQLLHRLLPSDWVFVEGFKNEPIPKIEVHRPSCEKPLLCLAREDIVAVASDATDIALPKGIILLPLNDVAAVANFILHFDREYVS